MSRKGRRKRRKGNSMGAEDMMTPEVVTETMEASEDPLAPAVAAAAVVEHMETVIITMAVHHLVGMVTSHPEEMTNLVIKVVVAVVMGEAAPIEMIEEGEQIILRNY